MRPEPLNLYAASTLSLRRTAKTRHLWANQILRTRHGRHGLSKYCSIFCYIESAKGMGRYACPYACSLHLQPCWRAAAHARPHIDNRLLSHGLLGACRAMALNLTNGHLVLGFSLRHELGIALGTPSLSHGSNWINWNMCNSIGRALVAD